MRMTVIIRTGYLPSYYRDWYLQAPYTFRFGTKTLLPTLTFGDVPRSLVSNGHSGARDAILCQS